MRSNARREVRTRSIGVISDSTVRIGLIFSAEPSHALAPAIRPPRRRYSSVSTANHIFSSRRAGLRVARHLGAVVPGARRRARGQHDESLAAAGAQRVDHVDAARQLAEMVARLLGRAHGARHPAGEMDRDDLVAGVDERLVDGEEVADRGLGGGGEALEVAQTLVIGVVVGDVELAQRLILEVHVEADLVDRVAGHERRGQVMTGVGDDGDGHERATLPARPEATDRRASAV